MTAAPATYRTLLQTDGVPRLLSSVIVARLPLGMQALAILTLVGRATGSFATAGVAVGALSLANAAASPVQGRLVDRWGPMRVIVPIAAVQAACFTALVVAAGDGAPGIVLVALTAAAGAFVPPVASASRALWPRVAPTPPLLERAYALEAIGQEVIWTTGPLVIALVLATASARAAVMLCAVVTVAGTVFFARAPVARSWRGTQSAERAPTAIRSPGLRLLLVSVVLTGLVWGAGEVALVGLAAEVGAPGMAGVLLALWSVGSLVGGLVYGSRAWRLGPAQRYTRMLALTAVALAPLALAESIGVALVLSAIAGVTIAPVLVGQYGLTGALAPPDARTEAFTWTAAGTYVGFSAGAAAAGALVEFHGSDAAFALVCAAAAVAAAGTVVWRSQLIPPPVSPSVSTGVP